MKNILLLDNFDSFTYNLYQQINCIKQNNVIVKRNNEINLSYASKFDILVISPGPKTPKDAGISNELIKNYYKTKPILGVCLGMQCINEVFGGKVIHAPLPVHGKTSRISHNKDNLFKNVPSSILVARYHSLIVSDIPDEIKVIAQTHDGIPMAIKHLDYPVYGVQFHPESFMTEYGNKIMSNFFEVCR